MARAVRTSAPPSRCYGKLDFHIRWACFIRRLRRIWVLPSMKANTKSWAWLRTDFQLAQTTCVGLIRRTPDGAFELDLDYFEFHSTARRSYATPFIDLFGPPREAHQPIDLDTADGRRFADCAASVQLVLEEVLIDIARALHRETGLPDLCLSGGLAPKGAPN